MCLVLTKNARRQIAEEDIPCIKIIIKDGKKWMTPYQNIRITPGTTVKSELIVYGGLFNTKLINVGIHSFMPGCTAKILSELDWFDGRGYSARAINCIIPKGAEYYVGSFESELNNAYASNQLQYPELF